MNDKTNRHSEAVSNAARLCTVLVLVLVFSVNVFSQAKNYQSLTANVNGVRVHYLKAGMGRRPLVLLQQDAEGNRKFAARKLPMPVFVLTGNKSMGDVLEVQAKMVAENVTAVKLNDTGHWLMEERPAETKAALKKFFGPTAQANQ